MCKKCASNLQNYSQKKLLWNKNGYEKAWQNKNNFFPFIENGDDFEAIFETELIKD